MFFKYLAPTTVFCSCSSYTLYKDLYHNNNKNNKKKFKPEEVAKHNKSNDMWVSYKNKVYNVTDFVKYHPGGSDKIMEAAGKPLEPYWNLYKQHNNEVEGLLKDYYVGDLIPDKTKINSSKNEPYKDEPLRSSFINDIKVLKIEPFNSESSLIDLRKNYITPINKWYIRNHHPVPKIDPEEYTLTFTSPKSSKTYTLQDLKTNFDKKSIITTIQCAGNRRKEFQEIDKVSGLNWEGGAISTAKFSGVSLKDLIEDACDKNIFSLDKFFNIHLYGYDDPFDGSVKLNENIGLLNDAIICYEMNDADLTPDHGYPVKMILPGFSGAKNVKWLKDIKIDFYESPSTWQQGIAYKNFGPSIKSIKDITEEMKLNTPTIEKMPVQSIICDIKNKDDELLIEGIAYSGGGNNILRVYISLDNGETWENTNLQEGYEQRINKAYAWTFWSYKTKLDKNKDSFNIVCKAVDINYNTQPDSLSSIWNLRGILNNSSHRVKYNIN
jgi:sulfite oxidase